jgi:hypothetical protein
MEVFLGGEGGKYSWGEGGRGYKAGAVRAF